MIVKLAKDTGHATVNYCATHSHPIKLSHIKIPTRIRLDNIVAQLQQGVSMEIVLDRIKDNATDELKREHLITPQDLHNIKTQYNIEGIIRHKNDIISLMSWVEEMRTLVEHNPVLLLKRQGDTISNEGIKNDHLNLKDDDFIMGNTDSFKVICSKNLVVTLSAWIPPIKNAYDFFSNYTTYYRRLWRGNTCGVDGVKQRRKTNDNLLSASN